MVEFYVEDLYDIKLSITHGLLCKSILRFCLSLTLAVTLTGRKFTASLERGRVLNDACGVRVTLVYCKPDLSSAAITPMANTQLEV